MSPDDHSWPASRILRVAGAVIASGLMFAAGVLASGFVLCGISGCSGGGYGPAYSPGLTQLLLLATGFTVLPAVLACTSRLSRDVTVAVALPAVVATSALALHLIGAGFNGCPAGMLRATSTLAQAFDIQSTSCARAR